MKNNRFIENLDKEIENLKGELLQRDRKYLAAVAGSKQLILRGVIMKMVYKIAVKATTRNCKAKFLFINTAK